MGTQRQELETEVKYIVGEREDLTADYPTWVRRAYQHLSQAMEFPEAFETAITTTIYGQRSYNLPTNYFSVYSLRNNTMDRPMIQKSAQSYDRLRVEQEGPAEYYAIFGVDSVSGQRIIHIHPSPAYANPFNPPQEETLQLRYRHFFPALDQATSESVLPAVWDQTIVQFAASFAFEATNELERARFYRNEALRFISEQQPRLGADLYDRNEAMQVTGGEII